MIAHQSNLGKSAIYEPFSFLAEVEETLTLNEEVPKSVNEALKEPNWVKAKEDELQSLKDNKAWNLVEPPEGKKLIGSRWHFKVKFGSNGKPCRHKARFVAKGLSQCEGIDYKDILTHRSLINSSGSHEYCCTK